MRAADLYVAGTGRWLPPPMPLERAAEEGLVERRQVWRDGIVSVCVSEGDAGPEMAVRAARTALRVAGGPPDEIDLVLHAGIYHQGHDLWSAASYVQRATASGRGPAIEVRQLSNGGMAALELAAGYLAAGRARRRALITTGDRFALPGIDRWRSDPGTVLGDGGTALVLSTTGGYARVRSLVTVSDPALEGMQRGGDPFGSTPLEARRPIDVQPAHRHFVGDTGLDAVLDRLDAGGREAFKRALSEAGAEAEEIAWFVLPNLGLPRLKEYFLDKFGIDVDRTLWSWGRHVGHLGAGDQIAGLDELAVSGRIRPGQLCLLAGVGAGFTWSCAVIEMLRPLEES
ncbi:ketoacyl-ACP synthase III family protein [Nonomuraea sp. NPDC050643]|uniref:ketoacyl-ACP synthase III family protein n=1 Tax=Nonomuraea sp. NPDC050643 TaxID=3155660 RepID=UPI0033C2EAD2